MLISELITNLEKIKKFEGDIEVVIVGEYYSEIHKIEFSSISVGYRDWQIFKTSKEKCEHDNPKTVLGILE